MLIVLHVLILPYLCSSTAQAIANGDPTQVYATVTPYGISEYLSTYHFLYIGLLLLKNAMCLLEFYIHQRLVLYVQSKELEFKLRHSNIQYLLRLIACCVNLAR